MKKIIPIILIIILALTAIVPYSYSGNANKQFFIISANKVKAGETLEMTINLNKIDYDQCKITLSTDINVEDIYENEDELELEIEDGELIINVNKEELSIEQITLYYGVPEDVKVETEYTIVATVTNLDNEEEQLASTVSVKVVENEEENNQADEDKPNEAEKRDDYNNDSNNKPNNAIDEKDSNNIEEMEHGLNQTKNEETMSNKLSETNGASLKIGSISTKETVTYNGSDNNYLSSLTVEGYELNKTFNKENATYFITVGSSVTGLNVQAIAEDNSAAVCVSGVDNLKTGTNKVLISITSESGAVRIYRIFVTKA